MDARPTDDTRRPRTISLNRRLTLTYALIAIPFMLASGWFMYQRQVAVSEKSNALLTERAEHRAAQLRESLLRAEQALQIVSIVTANLPAADCSDRLPALLAAASIDGLDHVRVADADGTVRCAVSKGESGGSAADRPEFQLSRSAGRVAVVTPSGVAEPLRIALPRRSDSTGEFTGAVLATLSVEKFALPQPREPSPPPIGSWLVDSAGKADALPGTTDAPPVALFDGKVDQTAPLLVERGDSLLSLAPVSPDLALISRFRSADVAPAIFGRFALPVAVLCGLLLTGLAVLLIGLSRWVVEPLQTLDRIILSGAGNSDDPGLSDLPDQIYHLGQSFASRHAEWSRDLQWRELLLQEVHHRIKNSFQMVLSLLRMQERSVTDPQAVAILRSAQERVSTLFIVHRMLERGADGEVAEAGELLWSIADTLISGTENAGRIAFDVDADPLPLRPDQAVVLGLIVNEWVINSLQHGFPGDRQGRIQVTLRVRDDVITLYYADDGIGRSDRSRRPGFGTRLISGLVQQLEGDLAALPGPGSRWELRFRMPTTRDDQPTKAPAVNDR